MISPELQQYPWAHGADLFEWCVKCLCTSLAWVKASRPQHQAVCAAPSSAGDDAPFGMLDSCSGLWCYDEMVMTIVVEIATYMIDRSKSVFRNINRAQRCPTLDLESALILGKARLSHPKSPQLQSPSIAAEGATSPYTCACISCCCPRMFLIVDWIWMSIIFS